MSRCSYFRREITTDDLNKHIAAYIGELPNVSKLIKCKNIEDDIIQANVEEITIGGSLSVGKSDDFC